MEIGIGYRFYEGRWMFHNENYITGASLRGWRDYFPNAQIYGCDIARSILFEDDRIKTFFMDQSKTDQSTTVQQLIAKEHVPLDIIVDDGSHVTEHQFLIAVCLLPLVKSGGIYVVEDVKRDNLNMFAVDNIRQNAQKYNIDDHKIDRFLRDIEKIETHIDFGPFKDKNGQGLIIIYKKPSVQ